VTNHVGVPFRVHWFEMDKPDREGVLRREIGSRIKDRRNELKLTQEQLATAAGVSKSFVSEIEAGQRGASGLKYLAIADALEVAVEWLLKGIEQASASQTAPAIPREVASVAEAEGWSYRETLDVSAQLQALVARRTSSGQTWKPTKDYIVQIHDALRKADKK
jgi:transcriptional regulator with XRE-family HTH domain